MPVKEDCVPEDANEQELSFDQSLKTVEVLFSMAHREASLFWIRNSLFIIVNVGAIGWSSRYFFVDSGTSSVASFPEFLFCLGAVALTLIWFLMNRAGRRLNHVFVRDARNLIQGREDLRHAFSESLGGGVPSQAGSADRTVLSVLLGFLTSPTGLNYFIILMFFCGWSLLLITKFSSLV